MDSGAESLATLLRAWRERAMLTQEQLARRTGLGVRTIGRLESGGLRRPRSESVRLLSDALELSDGERERLVAAARGRPVPNGPDCARVPRQLPAAAPGFVGRAEHLRQLDALAGHTTMVIVAIAGPPGVGKTTLAVHWAHRVADEFPDGQLYLNLRGFDPSGAPVTPAEAVRTLLDAFQVPADRIPVSIDAQTGLYRSLTAGRRMLLVLDNARDADQIQPLLPGTPECLTVVTSRNQLGGLVAAGASPVSLDVLTTGEARDLLTRHLGPERLAAEPAATDDLITACAGLPLALVIVAARAALHPTFPLAALAAELADAHRRLDTLDAADPGIRVRVVFSWSYMQLGAAAARLFRLLGLHPGPDISTPSAASLAALPQAEALRLLAELTSAHLIVEHVPGRYTFHDLIRAYATEQALTTDPEDQRHAAIHRLLDHYLHTGYAAHRLLNPHRDPISLTPPQPRVTPEHPADYEQAQAWFAVEHAVLLAAGDHAAATGWDTHTWQLAWTLTEFLCMRGHWHDWAATTRAAVAAADRLANPTAQVLAHRMLAQAYTELGPLGDAETHLRYALDLYNGAGDHTGQAHTHIALAEVCGRQGRNTSALRHAEHALDLHRSTGHQRGLAHALNLVGWFQGQLGDHQQALTNCQRALALLQEVGDRSGQATVWDCLGVAHHHLGHHDQAISCYQHALEVRRDRGDRYYETETLTHLGDTHFAAGNADAACTAWHQALAILDDLDHADADDVRAKLAALQPADGATMQPPAAARAAGTTKAR